MKLTREIDYAFRIVAMLSDERFQVEAKQISEKKLIPYRFTLKILRKLVHSGIVKSYRGINGGYTLNREPEEITLKDVIESIDGPIAINRCIEEPELCANSGDCQIQKRLLVAQQVFAGELNKVNFHMILHDEI